MPGLCEGRVAVITGAGRGLGRAYALELARQGAVVVVNDFDTAHNDTAHNDTAHNDTAHNDTAHNDTAHNDTAHNDAANGPANGTEHSADQLVDQIVAAGGRAAANYDNVADWSAAGRLVAQAVETFGRLDVVVNNAGILRDRTIARMTEDEWDSVIRVHLRGTAGMSHWAAAYWRDLAKSGRPADARIINTTSASGLYGSPSQSNYAAAKGGIAAFTVTIALELGRYGVTANAVAPAARTRLTEALISDDSFPPERVAPLVAWLASPGSRDVTGRVFDMGGDWLSVAQGWRKGPVARSAGGWSTAQIGETLRDLLAKAAPNASPGGTVGDL
jgi:NAD(P)-dependent dehydrogenase (short-subunit alcohol dehydrogenase family)